MLVYKIIIYISIASVSVPILLVINKYKARTFVFRSLGFLVLLSGIADLIPLLNATHLHLSANLFNILQFFLLTMILLKGMEIRNFSKLFLGISLVFLVLLIIDINYFYSLTERNTHLRLFSSFWFIILSIIFYAKLIENPPVEKIHTYPLFWIITAVLLYFSGNLFLYGANLIVENRNLYKLYIPIHSFFNVTKNLLFGYGIFLETKK